MRKIHRLRPLAAARASRRIARVAIVPACGRVPAADSEIGPGWRRSPLARIPLVSAVALVIVALVSLSGCTVAFGQPVVNGCDNGIAAPVRVQRDLNGSTIVVASVMIEGHGPFALAVDTGASVSIVDRSVADRAGLQQVGIPEPVAGVGGSQNAVPVQVNTWNVGKIQLPATRIATLTLPDAQKTNGIVGLLGSDVLSKFGVVQVDYSNSTLVVFAQVVPTTPTATPRKGR